MSIEDHLLRAKDFGIWLHNRTNELPLVLDTPGRRWGAGCFHLALEHNDAIIVLIQNQLYGSAWALARPLLEAYVRGVWLASCASNDEVERFSAGHCPKFNQLIGAIGESAETGGQWLHQIQKQHWRVLNEYVHGGAAQVVRRNTESAIESVYPVEELAELLTYATEVAIRVATEFFALARQEQLLVELKGKADIVREADL